MIDESGMPPTAGTTGAGTPGAETPGAQGYQQVPYTAAGYPPPPPAAGYGAVPPAPGTARGFDGGHPRPVLAALLGLIPGVGAMYNGQFAKGLAHIVIFTLLDSLAHGNGVFGALVAGFVFYQAFDAYHTAIARRDGLPLPDPLSLNNIGDIIAGHMQRNAAQQAAQRAAQSGAAAPTGAWGAPPATYAQAAGVPVPPPAEMPVGTEAPAIWAGASQAYPPQSYAAYVPPVMPPPPPVSAVWTDTVTGVAPGAPVMPSKASRFPGAAVWLIGLGVIFMLVNFFPDWHLNVQKILPFVLVTVGAGLLGRRLEASGGVAPREGEGDGYMVRVVQSLRAPVVLVTVGVLIGLEAFDGPRFGLTWPVLVIVLGVLLLVERSVVARAAGAGPLDGKGY